MYFSSFLIIITILFSFYMTTISSALPKCETVFISQVQPINLQDQAVQLDDLKDRQEMQKQLQEDKMQDLSEITRQ
jgi:hypothetical protein